MKEKPSLLIIGNSNVGKSSITKLLLPNPKKFKGKVGKSPGSTLLIKSTTQPNLPYKIIDLPGFGYTTHSSRRRGDHIKKQIVVHIEKHFQDYFLGLVVISILRIEDEINKYFLQQNRTIPLSFELIEFLKEFNIPILVVLNKIDKISNIDRTRIITLFLETSKNYGFNIVNLNQFNSNDDSEIPYLEFSALKKINLKELKLFIQNHLK